MKPGPGDFSPRDEFAPGDDAIDGAAATWHCERDEGFAPGRAAAFAAWCAADPRHAAALVRCARAMAMLAEDLPAARASLGAGAATAPRVLGSRAGRGRPAPFWTATGLAAALAVAAGVWWLRPMAGPVPMQTIASAAAQPQQVALADGSVVNLQASSEVRVQLTPRERRVALAAGEAHFAVAHDAARPFIVTAGGVSVRAVGTAFNVRVAPGGVEVLVTEGKVEVVRVGPGALSAGSTPDPARWAQRAPPQATLLSAFERMLIPALNGAAAMPPIERVSAEALRDAIRWHSSVMTFADVPLRDVVAQFNRRNVTQLSFADAALAERRIGGTFAVDQVEAFVRLLAQDGELAAERRGTAEIVLRRAP